LLTGSLGNRLRGRGRWLQWPSSPGAGKACGIGYSWNMRPLTEAGAKHEHQLWGTQAGAEDERQLGGGLTWCQAQSPNSAKVEGDNWFDCIAGSYLCTRKAQTVVRCCTYVRILHTGTCIVHIQTCTLHDKKDTQLLENPYP
jgi:hypothetical protein